MEEQLKRYNYTQLFQVQYGVGGLYPGTVTAEIDQILVSISGSLLQRFALLNNAFHSAKGS